MTRSERLQRAGVDEDAFRNAVEELMHCFRGGGKLIVFGNGGSAADAQHLAAEFVGRFELDRPPLAAIALTTDTSALTAIGNDFGFEQVFARQLEALGRPPDVAVAISTSGSSPNILAAVRYARRSGLRTIALVGGRGSELERLADLVLAVRGEGSAAIQEAQLTVEHELCRAVEAELQAGPLPAPERAPGRVIDWQRLTAKRETWRRDGLRVVWTNGVFDLLHVGHVRSLQAAAELGEVLVVGINGDETVRTLKGEGRPVVPADQRAEVVAALRCVDLVVVFDEATPERVLEQLRPDIHAKGVEYAGRPMPERALVEGYGGKVVLLPFVDGLSTTAIVSRIERDG